MDALILIWLESKSVVLFGSFLSGHSKTINAKVVSFRRSGANHHQNIHDVLRLFVFLFMLI